jgi:hypothetical protein
MRDAIETIEEQLSLVEITEQLDHDGAHIATSATRAVTGFWSVSCSCGWHYDTGKSASVAHRLVRAHTAGHASRVTADRG